MTHFLIMAVNHFQLAIRIMMTGWAQTVPVGVKEPGDTNTVTDLNGIYRHENPSAESDDVN